MRAFAELFERLDATTSTKAKVAAMTAYFGSAPPADAAWVVFLLSGQRFKRLISTGDLRAALLESTDLPQWLFEECYASVGDLAETLALLGTAEGSGDPDDLPLSRWIEERILPLRDLDEQGKTAAVLSWWGALPRREAFLLNKVLTGGLRVGVSRTLVCRALAEVAGLEPADVAHRLMGDWTPSATAFEALIAPDAEANVHSRPYPFYLASPLEGDPGELHGTLGDVGEWQVEWKWDGIRAQLIRRRGETFLWSRGEELITDRFPEIRDPAAHLPDGTVLDGEVLAWRDGAPLPFSVLQKRIGRRAPGRKILADAPVAFLVYDLLEQGGVDLRTEPLWERRRALEALLGDGPFLPSPEVTGADWGELARLRGESRSRGVEGLMVKRRDSPYRTGRKKGDWWKWKVEPMHLDGVMIYAQAGHGRRSNLFTDYTFAVWRGDELVPVAKAYSGLDDAEIRELDRWIRRHTRERFGPVRSVEPEQVFELAFESIQRSPRHKSGIALRFPRIARWRKDKTPRQADTLEQVTTLLELYGAGGGGE
ncbi:MAG: ATP-dependent DNA ligase [Acidobacteriota bacterium]